MVTVFTPTYNRSYILPELYKSLCKQTNKNFEWLIVDDGSTDDTQKLISKWASENIINIKSIAIKNGGKSQAINVGVEYALGNLFFIVDSDDFLTADAIEKILLAEKKLPINIPPLAGFYFRRKNSKTNYVYNSEFNELPDFATSLELAFLYHQIYDKAEVFYTDVLRKFPFPKIKNNKFIPEALVWYRIANAGYKLCVNTDVIYLGNYIEDGYTKNFTSNLKKNPKGFMMYYKECLFYEIIPLKNKIKYFIRYIQCLIFSIGR